MSRRAPTAPLPDPGRVLIRPPERAAFLRLAAWRSFDAELGPTLAALGVEGPWPFGVSREGTGVVVHRIAPRAVLIRAAGPDRLEVARAAAAAAGLAVVDLSDAFRVSILEGPGAEAVLARLVGVALDAEAFPVSAFARTGLHDIPVILRRAAPQCFELAVPSSLVGSAGEMLASALASVGERRDTHR
ncbi:hypothetical protein [Elioraea sp.]|uniref:hypothetical protein n=1 Tax=Elioraea sp. TaxID=2185103 RepID=UPI00307ED9BE